MKNILTCIILILTLSACSSSKKAGLEPSVYKDNDSNASLSIQSHNKILLGAPPETKLGMVGEYTIEDGKIYLLDFFNENEHVFCIEGDKLIFERGDWLETWVEKGCEFHLSDN